MNAAKKYLFLTGPQVRTLQQGKLVQFVVIPELAESATAKAC